MAKKWVFHTRTKNRTLIHKLGNGFSLGGKLSVHSETSLGVEPYAACQVTMELLSACSLEALTQATLKGLSPSPFKTEFRFLPTFLQGLLGRVTGLGDNLVHKNGRDENKHANHYFVVKTDHQKQKYSWVSQFTTQKRITGNWTGVKTNKQKKTPGLSVVYL